MPQIAYSRPVEAVFVPEPTDEEREALLAALENSDGRRDAGAWRAAALREGTETDDEP